MKTQKHPSVNLQVLPTNDTKLFKNAALTWDFINRESELWALKFYIRLSIEMVLDGALF